MIFRLKEENFSVEEQVAKAKSGDTRAFGKVYDALVDKIYRFIFFKVSEREIAEDLTQNVFLKALKSLGNYREDGTFLAWIYTIARNQVIDHYRTAKPRISLESVQSFLATEENMDLETKETYEELVMKLHKLSKEEQEVINLHTIEEYSFEEIAKITGKSAGSLRILKYRALIKLKGLLNENGKQ
jgi:RNA polymerase sigma-70 factor (ECF subfamily)